jgi:glycosyltransferase involved in cell wall biosynthesis
MIYNKFTILIPTRERHETLHDTLRTCLNQTYKNLEILVSDNFSQDHTKDVVMSFNDNRLKYINTGKRMSMSENFDFALSHVTDGYLMFIGDDDGLLPNSLEYVNDIINNTGINAIVSYNAFYTWPGTPKPNKLFWSPKAGYEIRNSKEWLKRYLTFTMEYTFDLPSAYCGFVKRDVFDKVTIGDKFFRSPTPDAYSALAIAFATDTYVYSHTPFAVHGSSTKSNGGSYLSTAKEKVGDEAKLFFKESTIPFHKSIVMTKAFRICSVEAFMQFSDTFPQLTKNYQVDWKTCLRFVMSERIDNTKDEIEDAVKQMCLIHNLNYEDIISAIPSKFTGVPFNDIIKRAIDKVKNTIDKKTIVIQDTTKFGVYNVYDAMLLLKFYLESNNAK